VINQGRYIIHAVLLLFLLLSVLFIFKKLVTTNPATEENSVVIEHNNVKPSIALSVGRSLFQQNCASCHNITKDMTGPALFGLEERGPWNDRKKLYDWIHNPPKFMTGSSYVKSLREKFGIMMTAFPTLSEKDIDAIVDYINSSDQKEGSQGLAALR
jgi:mono/diheme cytochrome c family protein